MSRRARAALVGMAALVCLVTVAAAAPMSLATSGEDPSTATTPQLAEAADMSFATLMIAPATAGAVILLASIALVISATRRGSKD